MKKLLREEDVFGRMGGDEFAILLPGTNEEGARRVAERLRLALVREPHDLNGVKASFSASFGVAQLGDKAPCLSTLIKQADMALYQSKNRGRNRVSCNGRQVFHEFSFSGVTTGL
ncbi:GGDEF domain-containing protein [Desulfatibacillum aliphaticivorans]|nr:GGDEF domain-containing protein [Desulfatibacillum aliphaticivorans]